MSSGKPETEIDLLSLIGKANRDTDSRVFDGVRRVFDGIGVKIPTLTEVIAQVGGRTAEMIAAGQAPATITEETSEIEEWRKQTDRFIELGFHDALEIRDPDKYRLTIPTFSPKPRTYEGSFDKPLAVEDRIPLPQLHQLMGVREFINTNGITNLRRVPKKPYTVYIVNSVETVVGTFDFAVSQLAKNGVAGSFVEVDMTYLQYPELFKSWLDAGDSRCGAARVPSLYVHGDGPWVHAYWALDPRRGWRLLSRGKKIGT